MNNPQLPNLQQTVANTILIINISNSNNINITRQLASFTAIKSTKRYGASYSVSDKHS